MGGFGFITAAILVAVACGCSCYLYGVMARKEGVTPQELAPILITAVSSGFGFVVAFLNVIAYYVYYRDDLKAWREERRRQAGPLLHALFERIRKEKSNFEKLRDDKPPKNGFSEYNEITPFILLAKDLKPVYGTWGYDRLVKQLLKEIVRVQEMPRGQKNVTSFIPLLERLEAKLEADVKGRSKILN